MAPGLSKDYMSLYLKEAEEHFKQLQTVHIRLSTLFREWETQRRKSIDCIDALQKTLEKIHFGCNAAHGAGSAMEIIGGLATILGFVLSATGHESAAKLIKGGSTVSAAGTVTTVVSTLAEAGLSHRIVAEIKTVLMKDEELTKPLADLLKCSRKSDSYLIRIFNCGILSDILPGVVQLCLECMRLLESGRYVIPKLINELQNKKLKRLNISDYSETAIQNVCCTLQSFYCNPSNRATFSNICNIIQNSPLAFKFAKVGLKVSLQVCDSLKVDLLSTALGIHNVPGSNVGVVITKCALSTIQVAFNIIAVVTAVENIKKGESKYTKMLNDLKLVLSMELNSMTKNYTAILDTNNQARNRDLINKKAI